jgi:small-conductance mechanosensitive channel
MWQSFVDRTNSFFTWLAAAFPFAPPWAVPILVLIVATAAAWIIHAATLVIMRRLLGTRRPYLLSVLDQTRNPTRLGLLLIAMAIALQSAPLGPDTRAFVSRLLGLGVICLIGWMALTALRIAANIYLMRFAVETTDNLLARKHVTQVRVLLRVAEIVIVLVTLGFALMTFDAVRQFGVTLFASAGLAGIVAGLAARPMMSNFLAGVQIAIAQPIRIGDAVIVENEWGNVEEITFSYVVLKLWDLRRLVVPISYFIEKPFQNWTRTGNELVGSVVLYVDHTTPVDAVRKKLTEIVAQSKLWNGRVVNLQVTDCKETTIELRALVSADNAGAVSDLRAEVREKLIDFLQREHPHALPRRRNEFSDASILKVGEQPAAPSQRKD